MTIIFSLTLLFLSNIRFKFRWEERLDIGILACSIPFCHRTKKIAINKSQSFSGEEISHHLLNDPLNVFRND